jgi:tetratricopeptide (TPR) repeat protein
MSALDFEALMTRGGIGNLTDEDALQQIGLVIDAASDRNDDAGIDRAFAWCDELEQRKLTDLRATTLSYFRANAWGVRYRIHVAGKPISWNWEQPELAEEIFCLRKAIAHKALLELPSERQCQMLTNTANCLHAVGRFVEAIELFTRALRLEPNFWEALGNRGKALIEYGRSHYDHNHSYAIFVSAHDNLKRAVEIGANNEAMNPGARMFFQSALDDLEKHIDIEAVRASLRLTGHSVGNSDEEKRYRRWCLANCLFLNSLNEMGDYDVAACDILSQPTFTTSLDEPPTLIGFFNQLKQEFVSARYLYYQSQQDTPAHFSDRDVVLMDTLDYPAYGIRIEQMKMAFRMAYSLFDKTAFFLYRYLKLPMKPTQVTFSSVWREKQGKKAPLRKQFESLQNWPLRGLFWLSKDIVDEEFRKTTEPSASELYEIRNQLEHKYLKVHFESMGVARTQEGVIGRTDDLAYSILDQDLSIKTLRVLKLARAALIYLSLGMHQEERRKNAAEKKGGKGRKGTFQMPMSLRTFPDEWKR